MGLLVECPECKYRNSPKAKSCKCGFALNKFTGRVYWIEWYEGGKRARERIGPNKAAAEQRYREVKSALCEDRHIRKNPDAKTTFKELADWYMNLADVKAKKGYKRHVLSWGKLIPFFGDLLLKDIDRNLVEEYKQNRLAEPSGRTPQSLTKPATVNREIALFKAIFNRAIASEKAERYPAKNVKRLKENNERDRVLSSDEYVRLLAHCPAHLRTIIKVAYYTGMRQGEILNLTWGQVDLKEDVGFINLRPGDTKTNEGRSVPIHPELKDIFESMPQGLPGVKVFTYSGRSVASIKRSFATACKKAGIEDFTFHDFRHTAITNWRLQGHDYFRIMSATGHKTMSVFKRYNTVSKEELKLLVGEKK